MNGNTTMVVDTRGLSKSYPGVDALKSLSLQVPKNSIFAFLGPNGAGKSTAIRLLLGLARPTQGSGTIFGLDIVRDSVAIRQRVGYLAQDPRYYEYMTARETLTFVAGFFYRGQQAAVAARVNEVLELVGLADKADRAIRGFSGGERQRLGIAQAYINHPDLLILDEPAAALDPLGRRDVLEVMASLRHHTTIFYSTHILEDVQRVSDYVAIMNRGSLVMQGPIDQLLNQKDTITYTLNLTGNLQDSYTRVTNQPWVASVNEVRSNGTTIWHIQVTDEAAAEANLLKLVLADGQASVVNFGRKRQNLEEAFVALIEGDQHVHA
jgi:ABC-2 type transport system ATP-binding protein